MNVPVTGQELSGVRCRHDAAIVETELALPLGHPHVTTIRYRDRQFGKLVVRNIVIVIVFGNLAVLQKVANRCVLHGLVQKFTANHIGGFFGIAIDGLWQIFFQAVKRPDAASQKGRAGIPDPVQLAATAVGDKVGHVHQCRPVQVIRTKFFLQFQVGKALLIKLGRNHLVEDVQNAATAHLDVFFNNGTALHVLFKLRDFNGIVQTGQLRFF